MKNNDDNFKIYFVKLLCNEFYIYLIYFDNFRFLILKLKSYFNIFIIFNNKFK